MENLLVADETHREFKQSNCYFDYEEGVKAKILDMELRINSF